MNGKGFKSADLGAEWEGGLGYKGVEYWVGPSEVDVRVRNEVNNRVSAIWSECTSWQEWARARADGVDTMATIPGHVTDEVVIVGNHRDGTFHAVAHEAMHLYSSLGTRRW